MGKVMKADASADLAWVEFDLSSGESDVWLTFQLAFTEESFSFFTTGGGYCDLAILFGLLGSFDNYIQDQGAYTDYWVGYGPGNDPTAEGSTPPPVAAAWMLCEIHLVWGGAWEFYINGTLVWSTTNAYSSATDFFRLGIASASGTDPDAVVYFDDVKLGTSRGGNDLFSDDFEDGTFDAWTSTSGDVSVVDDPFAVDAFALGPVFSVAFDDPTLEANPTWTQVG